MLKFKLSLLFNNLKFRIALVVVAIAAIVVGIICIPKNKASQTGADLTNRQIIQETCKLLDKNYNGKGTGGGHGTGKIGVWANNGTGLTGQKAIDNLLQPSQFDAFDCTGMIYYVLTKLGCSTTGFSKNNPVPYDPDRWYYTDANESKLITENSNLNLIYNGKTTKINIVKCLEEITPTYRYYNTKNGGFIPSGSIVIATSSTATGSDHGWIYLGNLNTTDAKTAAKILIKDYGVDASYLINGNVDGEFTIKQYKNDKGEMKDCIQSVNDTCTHWRIECTSHSNRHGVYINNGDPDANSNAGGNGVSKPIGKISVFQLADVVQPAGNYTVEVVKVKQDGTTVITSSPATFNVNGADKNTTNGVLSVVANQKISSADQHDTYTITETNAPEGFNKYNGTISLNVYFKNENNKYIIDKEKTLATSEPVIGGQFMKISDDCKKITLYVPNEEQGKYTIDLVKVKQDGTTVITSSEATFNIDGADKNTTNGVLNIVADKQITDVNATDAYKISETKAPEGFTKYNGTIDVKVGFKNDNGYKLDATKVQVTGSEAGVHYDVNDSKITIYVPNDEQGKYTLNLVKVAQDGTTVITSSEATFDVNGIEEATKNGMLNIAVAKKITDVNKVDEFTIKETKAPEGYQKYNGTIDVKIGFKNDNGYKLDSSKIQVTGSEAGVHYDVNDSRITVYVPNVKTGSYEINLVKTDKQGNIINIPAKFDINGNKVETVNGVIKVADKKNCATEDVDQYIIKEESAPHNYILSNGTIKLSVHLTKTANGYELLNDGVNFVTEGDMKNASIKVEGSKIVIYVPNEKEPFDMALRKFITKINGKDVDVSREPVIDEESIKVLEQTGTAAYHHPKNSLLVNVGDEVEYTLRVYNEGKILGYAKQITDYLPEGLSFVRLSPMSLPEYTTSSEEGSKVVVIDCNVEKEIPSLRDFIGKKEVKVTSEYYQEVKLICKVNDVESLNFTNRAEITNYGYLDMNQDGQPVWREAKEIGNSDQDSIQDTIKDQLNLDTWTDNAEPYTYTDKDGNVVKIDDYYPGAQDDDDFEVVHIVSEPELHKGVKSVDNQNSGYSYFDIKSEKTYSEEALSSVLHDWVIESSIVKGINNFKLYEIVDNVDTSKLDFAGLDKVKVSLINKEGNVEKVLVNDTDYKATYKDGKLVVTIISNEPEFKGQFLNSENSLAGYKVRVEFNTTFKVGKDGKLVVLADKIENAENQATLNYNNGHEDKTIKSEIPEVHTGAVSVFKYEDANKNGKFDQGEKALVGAKFKIAYDAEGTNFVKDLDGNDVVAISNEKGVATFTGLSFGGDAKNDEANKNNDGTYSYNWEKASSDYYVVEVEAPEGFTLLEEKVKVTVSKNSSECIDLTDKMVCIANVRKYFDLSLRKFITEVNGVKPETSREPQVDISKLASYEATTATYNHPKDTVDVNTSDIVTYTIRVYNEGDYDGFANEVMDDIPDGLEFLPENETNKDWIMCKEVSAEEAKKLKDVFVRDGKNYVETKDAKEADVIVTTCLSKENGDANLIKAFDGKTLDYKDVKVAFKVVEPTTSDRVLVNYAQVTEHSDANGNTTIEDRDSTPNKWVDGEDDQDTEKVKVRYFDLALLKYVSKAIVYENGKKNVVETGHTGYENPEPVVKVDLKKTSLKDVTVKFEYTIKITNEGEVEGYAKEISDYIPQGLKFVADDNKNWKEVDGKIVTDALANTLLKPGESAEVTVILTWINGENNLGLKTNIAEISKDYNEWGTPDIDSTPNNKVPGEDDIDDAPVILAVRTGINNTFFAIAAVSLVIVVAGIVVIKKKVLVK